VLCRAAFHLAGDAPEALDEEIVKVPPDAVDRKEAQVVDVEVAVAVRLLDLGGVDLVEPPS